MNINQLRYFISVAECRSFSKAAAQNYVSQTAITQQIQSLETQVGTELIDRSKRPIELTLAGSVFLTEAKAIIERLELAINKTAAARTGLEGRLRIGYTKGYEYSNFPQTLKRFHRDFPNIVITCFRRDTDMLASDLLNGDYDIIFTWDSTNIRMNEHISTQLLERVPFMVAVYPGHPFAHRTVLKRSELRGERILFMSPSSDGNSFGDAHYIQLYEKAGYQPNIILRTSDMESIIMMVEAEVGISILPAYCAKQQVPGDSLIFIPLEGDFEYEEIIAAWRKDEKNPPLARFLSYL